MHWKGSGLAAHSALPELAGSDRYKYRGKDATAKQYLAMFIPGLKHYALRTGNIGYVYDRYTGKFEACNVAEIEADPNTSRISTNKPDHLPKYIFINPIEFDSFDEVVAQIKADFPELEDWNRTSDWDYNTCRDSRVIAASANLVKKVEVVGLKNYRRAVRENRK